MAEKNPIFALSLIIVPSSKPTEALWRPLCSTRDIECDFQYHRLKRCQVASCLSFERMTRRYQQIATRPSASLPAEQL
jgi:hypothetical protein